jgi:hypothetical protein
MDYTAIKQYLDRRIREKEAKFRPTMGISDDATDVDTGMLWAFREAREFVDRLETIPLGG